MCKGRHRNSQPQLPSGCGVAAGDTLRDFFNVQFTLSVPTLGARSAIVLADCSRGAGLG